MCSADSTPPRQRQSSGLAWPAQVVRHIENRRIQIAADGGVTIDLTPFEGVAILSWQQLGETIATVAAQARQKAQAGPAN